jgi:hypothetical protein
MMVMENSGKCKQVLVGSRGGVLRSGADLRRSGTILAVPWGRFVISRFSGGSWLAHWVRHKEEKAFAQRSPRGAKERKEDKTLDRGRGRKAGLDGIVIFDREHSMPDLGIMVREIWMLLITLRKVLKHKSVTGLTGDVE